MHEFPFWTGFVYAARSIMDDITATGLCNMAAPWTVENIPSQAGKTAIVTGANSGLGLETTVGLAGAGATVVMACRNPAKAKSAVEEVCRRIPGAKLEVMALDLANLASVRAFASEALARFPRINLLVNNAGIMAIPFQKTADGFEMQMGTNHLGHFALTGLLFDRLVTSGPSRIVSLASQAHRLTRTVNVDDLNFERSPYRKWDAYGKSKLGNLLFMFELSRRVERAALELVVAAAHPGYAATNLQLVGPRQEGSAILEAASKFSNAVFAQPAGMGALPSLYAATCSEVRNGDYIGPDGWMQMSGFPKRVDCRAIARDEDLGLRFWNASSALTGIRFA